jgi:hypothetical protein
VSSSVRLIVVASCLFHLLSSPQHSITKAARRRVYLTGERLEVFGLDDKAKRLK